MTQEMREKFVRLDEQSRTKNSQARYALIAFLQSSIDCGDAATFEDVGFCYWNISDQYALLRDGHRQCENHRRFYEHVSLGDAAYLYWLVNDATQKLTLEKDGYGDVWWEYYYEAVQRNETKGLPIECGVHRAALYKNPLMATDERRVSFAKERFENFLSHTKEKAEYDFYSAMYLSSVAQYEAVAESALTGVGESLLGGLMAEKSRNDFLIGEWSKFTDLPDPRRRAEVGIYAVINALIYAKKAERARRLYDEALSLGLPKNAYIEKRL